MAKISPRLFMGLHGARGLLAAVLAQAAKDAVDPTDPKNYIDSWDYIKSDNYSHHLDLLGLEPDSIPTMIQDMTLEQISQGISTIYRSELEHG